MRKLNAKEYWDEETAYLKKYSEFMDKYAEINVAENKESEELIQGDGDGLHKWSRFKEKYPEKVAAYEQQRNQLKAEYGIYVSLYNADFYTPMSIEYLEILRQWYAEHDNVAGFWESNAPLFYAEKKRCLGRKVQIESSVGILKDICVSVDDYYYLVDVDGEEEWITGCARIELYIESKEKSE